MPNYRRAYLPGGTYFFTVNLLERRNNHLLIQHIDLLRAVVRQVKHSQPFHIDAWVVLSEHMHCIWTLPQDDANYSQRWHTIKTLFSRALPVSERRNQSRQNRGERGIWQRRFWEHVIRDEKDFWHHVNYIYYNPVKHGLVKRTVDWPYSSFHAYVRQGIYLENWVGNIDAKAISNKNTHLIKKLI